MKREQLPHLSILVAAALALSACGGDDDSGATEEQATIDVADNSGNVSNDAPAEVESADTDGESGAESGTVEPDAAPNQRRTEATEAASTTEAASPDAEDEFAPEATRPTDGDFDGANFRDYGQRTFVRAVDDPQSTFALDVDTGSFSIARTAIDNGSLPPIEAVRPEEFINSYDYGYESPEEGLGLTVNTAPSPFDRANLLLRVGVSSERIDRDERPPVALTFVVDTSGSMDRDNRLPLVRESLEVLVEELDEEDTVAIVTYSDESGVVLEPTPISERDRILNAIDDLRPGGSTNLESGLRTAYELAGEAFRDDGINRVVLASDGIANVGMTEPGGLAEMIGNDAERGIDLVTLGFGLEGYNDVTMEQLANRGDGFYAYIDTEDEADRLFRDELTASLVTVAKNAKIQVEFDPELVDEYRLVGYENRGVLDSDFRNDEVDAGEIGAGHEATAIYEIELNEDVNLDPSAETFAERSVGTVSLRWEDPESGDVTEIDERLAGHHAAWEDVDISMRKAAVLTGFAELLRYNEFATSYDLDDLAGEADDIADDLEDEDWEDLADLINDADDLRS